MSVNENCQIADFGAGCFWCVEAVFERLDGVLSVVSGYEGGRTTNPTYKQVCNGNTGHAEVVRITFEQEAISFEELLKVFWKMHDPTTPNRQGADHGTQYRSVIFYHTADQRNAAETSRAEAASSFSAPIVTEISPASEFYEAEDYHQDYFRFNPQAPYCSHVIAPKLQKLG